ncbi:MAG TPA: thioredoxin domain-containing protein [Candidatus Saccharimonadales bacterium]|nr:thioredoxin domain-containing protein [Candidatus Saccharimonadales bacterium]
MKMKMVALIAVVMMAVGAAWAGDTSALHPPAGSRMALVVFEDLQCPACAKADPVLLQAERNYGVALVRHDFVIPNHPWSKEAHIMARYFDTQSQQLGEEFRQYIFANQASIYKTNLRQFADKFAGEHHTALPAFYDPTGALRAKVEADTELGKATGVHQTPTIYVVSSSSRVPFVEVTEQSKLFETIEQVKSALGPAPATKTKTKAKK